MKYFETFQEYSNETSLQNKVQENIQTNNLENSSQIVTSEFRQKEGTVGKIFFSATLYDT